MSANFPILQQGTLLNGGRYRVVKLIYEGGMGRLYKGWHIDLGISIAIKENTGSNESQFRIEGQILAKLNHQNLPHGFDFFRESLTGIWYIIMDFVESTNLHDLAMPNGLAEDIVLPWFDGILNAVEHLHKLSIIHRDIKPQNIIITAQNNPMLIDFGIAKLLARGQPTIAGARGYGTPPYAPPEQASGRTDERSDIHALGKTLEFALTGQDARAPYQSLYPTFPNVSQNTDAVIRRAAQSDPNQRFASVQEMRQALYAPVPPPPPPSPPRNWFRYVVASALGVILVTFVILLILAQRDGNSNPSTAISVVASPSASNNIAAASPSTPSPTRTFSSSPTSSATSTWTFTFTPSQTRTHTFTPTLTKVTPTATSTPIPVFGEFAQLWRQYRNQLGEPINAYFTEPRQFPDMAEQWFEQGHMFATGDMGSGTKKIIVVKDQGENQRWILYQDRWVSGESAPCGQANQSGHRVIRGFGKLWCERELWNVIGYPRDKEYNYDQISPQVFLLIQWFENGIIFRDSDGKTKGLAYVFINGGAFYRVGY